MSLGNTADRGVAGHLRDQIEVQRKQRRTHTHARSGHRGLAARVPGANHHYIELFANSHHSILLRCIYNEGVTSSVTLTVLDSRRECDLNPTHRN